MTRFSNSFIIVCCLILLPSGVMGQETGSIQYVHPRPSSSFVTSSTNIAFRQGQEIDPSSVRRSGLFTVTGAQSGLHRGVTALSDDGKTVVFNPAAHFAEEEQVTVVIGPGLRTVNGTEIPVYQFGFKTSRSLDGTSGSVNHAEGPEQNITQTQGFDRTGFTIADSLPADFPSLTVTANTNPAVGELFIGGFSGAGGNSAIGNYLIVADNSGKTLAYKRVGSGTNPFAYMFKVEPDGRYSYIDRSPVATNVWILDSTLKTIDSYPRGNPATTSHADFMLLPNGHALVLYFDIKTIDMSKIVKGGHPAATVWGNLVQEFDLNKNVIFQWSSFDYLPIPDTYEDTLAASFDYSHANGIEPDADGNFLLSNRHMSEITKIDRNSGEVLWRWGGKRNQFTFNNERSENAPNYFSYLHSVRRLENGNIILFDNGNQHSTKYSRVVEYKLDEAAKTATLVWEYRHFPDIYASAQGSVQRLPNGNTLIGWGDASVQGKPAITEVRPDKSVAFEMTLPLGYRTMRVYRLPWRPFIPAASYTRYELLKGNTYSFNDTTSTTQTGAKIRFDELMGIFYNTLTVRSFVTAPANLLFIGRSPRMASQRYTISQFGIDVVDAEISFDTRKIPPLPDPRIVSVYRRDTVGRGMFMPLPTSYNSVTKEIVARITSFGEFMFGWSDEDSSAGIPILLTPADGDSLNRKAAVGFNWNPRGTVTGYQFQVAADSLFRTIVLNDSLLMRSTDTLRSGTAGLTYYWRVRAFNGGRTGSWTPVRKFSLVSPYISVRAPVIGEKVARGVPSFIRWTSNISDKLRLELYRRGIRLQTIRDSVANVGAFSWTVPTTLTPDSLYQVGIRSVADSTVSSLSATFEISNPPTGIDDDRAIPRIFALQQNFPNPFNPRTAISYQLSALSIVGVKIYDLLGREIATLVEGIEKPGRFTVLWNASLQPSGIYIARIRASSPDDGRLMFSDHIRMLLVK